MRILTKIGRIDIAAAVLLCALSAAIGLLAQTNLTGVWILRVPRTDGTFNESFFELKQDGEAIAGTMLGNRETPIADGSFKDGKLHFVVRVGAAGKQQRETAYDGVLDGGKLQMTQTVPGRDPVKSVAERSTREAANPARLPVPDLRDVRDNGLARTPPMGWNSWNLFAGRVDDKTVRGIADAMVSSGMRDAGYVYVNIDDTWEGARDADGNVTGNLKFPDMKGLADYVHSKGLKIGIYSSPGPKTCAGYEGSYGHEAQDAKTYAAWGFDYLKYDWCSASRMYKDEDMQAVYQKMGDALLASGRPVVFSLCQYGRQDVWKWGPQVGGNLWRTTGDISDRWQSMDMLGFRQLDIATYSQPGHVNDPDMLEIGNGGMNGDEYRTHMSLWSMLSAALLAGNDIRNMSEETKSILMNREVIGIDQDPGVRPVKTVSQQGTAVVLAKELSGGAVAIGLFNRGDQPAEISVNWAAAGLTRAIQARDLWKHEAAAAAGPSFTATVPRHGVVLLRASAR